MSLLVELVWFLIALCVGTAVRRYFILTSGQSKTNLKFIKSFNLLLGSKDIIFANDKVLAVNAHDRHKELGDTFGCYFGQNMQVFSKDPELIYRICVDDFRKHPNRYYVNSLSPYMRASLLEARDEKWQTSRRAVGSVLKSSKLKVDNVETDLDDEISKMLASIDRRIKESDALGHDEFITNVCQINKNFFLQSILKIILNTDKLIDFDSHRNEVVEELYNFINVNYEFVARICFLIPILTDLVRPLIEIGFFSHGKYLNLLTQRLEEIVRNIVSDDQIKGRLTTIHSLINSCKNRELTQQQLMGNAFFLMLAGFATSVDTMSALMWELARNQEIQDKLREDLLQYGEGSTYLEQCINETLRLYPGAITNRELSEDVYHKDFRLVKGSCFNLSIYSLHRDPKYWGEDADIFRPERFSKKEKEKFHPAQFIPFGIGPRNCVGYNLAKLELTKFTVQFVLKYKLEFCPRTIKKLEFVKLGALPFALPIEGPINLKISPRTQN